MSEEEKSKAPGVAGAAINIAVAYKEEFLPAARQLGKAAELVGRTVNVALGPVYGVVWGAEKLQTFITDKVAKKLEKTPLDQIKTPATSIVAPALDAVRFRGEEPDVQDMFANLIASAMDRRSANRIFPTFVEVLRQLTSDEAKILHLIGERGSFGLVNLVAMQKKDGRVISERLMTSNLSMLPYDAGCEHPSNGPTYVDNLARLGIIRLFDRGIILTDDTVYAPLESHPDMAHWKARCILQPGEELEFQRSGFDLTSFGDDFLEGCVRPYEHEEIVLEE